MTIPQQYEFGMYYCIKIFFFFLFTKKKFVDSESVREWVEDGDIGVVDS